MSEGVFPGPSGSLTTPAPVTGRVVVNKTFAKPFRVILTDSEERTRVFEVRSLAGLRSLFDRIEREELREISKFASVQMQLWGFLAEHSGFMQATQPRTMEAGLGVLGPSAALVDDMADLFGGVDAGVEVLRDARRMAGIDKIPSKTIPLEEMRHQGVVEVSNEIVKKALEHPLDPDIEQAADVYKRVAAQSENDEASARKAIEDYTNLGDLPNSLRGDPVEPKNPYSGSEKTPKPGLDEQGTS